MSGQHDVNTYAAFEKWALFVLNFCSSYLKKQKKLYETLGFFVKVTQYRYNLHQLNDRSSLLLHFNKIPNFSKFLFLKQTGDLNIPIGP